jgi:NAD(P) transhydrogenase subunit alpha
MSEEFIAAEMALFKEQAGDVDIIITTALIPGKEAPKLITKDMVEVMKPGSIIVDLASQQGGNCELCEKDAVVEHHGVKIVGFTDLPSRLPSQSSELYSNNLFHILDELTPAKDGSLNINMEDDVIRGMTVVKDGSITYPPPKIQVSVAPKQAEKKVEPIVKPAEKKSTTDTISLVLASIAIFIASINIFGGFAVTKRMLGMFKK